MDESKEKPGLFRSTALLLLSNSFVKGLGFFYRVALARVLGAEGLGLVEMATPLFAFLLVLAGCGIQPALSQLTAGRGRAYCRAYFRVALTLLVISGSLVTLAAWLLSPLLVAEFAGDPRVALCLQMLLPAVFVISIASAWRGYFQGQRQVQPIAVSQNVEQILRVLVGLTLARLWLDQGLEVAVCATSVATVGGELAGFLVLARYLRQRQANPWAAEPRAAGVNFFTAAQDLLRYGLPMTGGRLAASAILMLQAFLIPLCLQNAGWDVRSATELYGRFAGVAMTLLHLPGVFTAALTFSVLPVVAESLGDQDGLLRRRVESAVRAALAFTLPGMTLLFLLADPLCSRLFDNPPAAAILRVLAPGGLFFYLQLTLASVLQGLGAVRQLLVNNLLAGLVMLVGVLALVSRPELGILGAALAADLSWLAAFCFHLLSCRQAARLSLPWRRIAAGPLLAAVIAAAAYYLTCPLLARLQPGQSMTAALAGAVVFGLVYLTVLALRGELRQYWRR